MSTNKVKKERLTLFLETGQKEELKKLARMHGETLSEYLYRAGTERLEVPSVDKKTQREMADRIARKWVKDPVFQEILGKSVATIVVNSRSNKKAVHPAAK